jgi:hypothetical protein
MNRDRPRREAMPCSGQIERDKMTIIDISAQIVRQPWENTGQDIDEFWDRAYRCERKYGTTLVVMHMRNLRGSVDYGWTVDDYWFVNYRSGENLGRPSAIEDSDSDEYLVVGRVLDV